MTDFGMIIHLRKRHCFQDRSQASTPPPGLEGLNLGALNLSGTFWYEDTV